MERYNAVVQRVVASGGVVVLLGGLDSGKSTMARTIAGAAVEAGKTAAYLDTDLGQKTVGPPTCVTLRLLREPADLAPEALVRPDALYFVGSTSPQGQLLPLVVGAARLLRRARVEGAELVVVDTSGLISGVYGQILKFHKVELLQPDVVIGLQRGEELEPILGIVQRFFSCEVLTLPVHPDTRPTSVEERAANREAALRAYFSGPLQRWRVKPTVFMPALPALFDQSQLDRLLVGLADGKGEYTGLGYLEYAQDEQVLRLLSPVPEAPRALRLGSVRLEEGFRARRVDLRNLFGSD
ncbi:MAG TPA: polynucleotide 5'-hydroxyl-kinase [Actinomycetota bacterium]|nr:polynucleotide 5'-hydroxyl-kinase [Actinomycetota bacterium]